MVVSDSMLGVALVASVPILYILNRVLRKEDEGGEGRPRSMSFNSSVMLGSFPEKIAVAPPIVNTVLFFKNSFTKSQLVSTFEAFGKYDRLRSTIKEGVKFEMVDELDVAKDHVEMLQVANDKEMKDLVDEVCGKDLPDHSKIPPWRIVCINNKKGNSVVLMRMHHVVGDGIAMIGAMSTVVKEKGTGAAWSFAEKAKSMKGGSSGEKTGVFEKLGSAAKVLGNPKGAFDTSTAFFPSDKNTLTMASQRRVAVHLPTVTLDFVKDIKNAANVTVNDVMLAVISGTIRRFSLKNGSAASELASACNRALLPVALPRPPEELESGSAGLRNKWAFASVKMPVEESTGIGRLASCNAATKELKQSSIVGVQYYIQTHVLPFLPAFLRQQTAYELFQRHSMVFSNLPGDDKPMTLAGEEMLGLQVVFPNLLPQCLLISYNGQMFANLCVNPDLVNPEGVKTLQGAYLEEFTEMADSLGVSRSAMMGQHQLLSAV